MDKLEETYGVEYSNVTADELDSYLVSIGYVNLANIVKNNQTI